MFYACTTGLVSVLLSLLVAGANAAEASMAAHQRPAAATASWIHYQEGRLSARIENRPLIEVLRELGAATGARFILSDPGGGQVSVYAAIESQPFVEGVKRILKHPITHNFQDPVI